MTDETERSGCTIIGDHIDVRCIDPVECVEIDGHLVPADGTPWHIDGAVYVVARSGPPATKQPA